MADTTNIICEKGPRGFDGARGPRGAPGEKGEPGPPLAIPFIDLCVSAVQSNQYDDGDLVDGSRKIAFPLQDHSSNGLITMKKHPSGVFETLGTRVILPEFAVYEYSFEVYVRNNSGVATRDISIAVLVATAFGAATERLHTVKQVPVGGIAKFTGTGLTYGVLNIWDGGSVPERTFYLRVVSSDVYSILPNGTDADTLGIFHYLTIKQIADAPLD